jgi:hypothetical protein
MDEPENCLLVFSKDDRGTNTCFLQHVPHRWSPAYKDWGISFGQGDDEHDKPAISLNKDHGTLI